LNIFQNQLLKVKRSMNHVELSNMSLFKGKCNFMADEFNAIF
jgi:hypothetical protein